ncbi:uncharacterized protein EV154DRAFT_476354 [Mucor mucedo]|uniref:uncharacterized protein n=1 Tax=Mucor mucedo TaxID=29922 RepID=UPI00221EF656|nr:uncharacterized protein EV154DRAFT_476354 [Mucor mucedo]KAI7896716.1 hypothetical protein EV154DRAFT_476354 [Mucor mucedo]
MTRLGANLSPHPNADKEIYRHLKKQLKKPSDFSIEAKDYIGDIVAAANIYIRLRSMQYTKHGIYNFVQGKENLVRVPFDVDFFFSVGDFLLRLLKLILIRFEEFFLGILKFHGQNKLCRVSTCNIMRETALPVVYIRCTLHNSPILTILDYFFSGWLSCQIFEGKSAFNFQKVVDSALFSQPRSENVCMKKVYYINYSCLRSFVVEV